MPTELHGLPIGPKLEAPQLNNEIVRQCGEAGTLRDDATATFEIVYCLFDEERFETRSQTHSRDHLLLRVASMNMRVIILLNSLQICTDTV